MRNKTVNISNNDMIGFQSQVMSQRSIYNSNIWRKSMRDRIKEIESSQSQSPTNNFLSSRHSKHSQEQLQHMQVKDFMNQTNQYIINSEKDDCFKKDLRKCTQSIKQVGRAVEDVNKRFKDIIEFKGHSLKHVYAHRQDIDNS